MITIKPGVIPTRYAYQGTCARCKGIFEVPECDEDGNFIFIVDDNEIPYIRLDFGYLFRLDSGYLWNRGPCITKDCGEVVRFNYVGVSE